MSSCDPSTFDFGKVPVDGTATRTITVANTDALNVLTLSAPPGFTVSPTTVPRGTTTNVTVTFSPVGPGSCSGDLTDGQGTTLCSLSGTGVGGSDTLSGGLWMQVFVPLNGYESALRLGLSDVNGPNGTTPPAFPRPTGISLMTNGVYFSSTTDIHQQLAGGVMSAYGFGGLNLGGTGGVVVASVSSDANDPDKPAVPGVLPVDGTSAKDIAAHDHFVKQRNKVYNGIKRDGDIINLIGSAVSATKTILGMAGIEGAAQHFFGLLGASGALMDTTAKGIALATPGATDGANASSLANKTGGAVDDEDPAAPGATATASTDDASKYLKKYGKNVGKTLDTLKKLVKAYGKNGEALGKLIDAWESGKQTDALQARITAETKKIEAVEGKNAILESELLQLEGEHSEAKQNLALFEELQMDDDDDRQEVQDTGDAVARKQQELDTARTSGATETDAAGKKIQSENALAGGMEEHVGSNAGVKSRGATAMGAFDHLGKAASVAGAAGGAASIAANVEALKKPKKDSPSGVAIVSDNQVFIGSKADLTAVASNGVNFFIPDLANFTTIAGGGISMQSMLPAEIFSMLGASLEGLMNATVVSARETVLACRLAEVKVLGVRVTLGHVKPDPPWSPFKSFLANPFAQKPTVGVGVNALAAIDLKVGAPDAATGKVSVTPTSIKLEAPLSITLQCGATKIELKPDGVTITAPKLTVNAPDVSVTGKTSITGPTEVSPSLKVTGALNANVLANFS